MAWTSFPFSLFSARHRLYRRSPEFAGLTGNALRTGGWLFVGLARSRTVAGPAGQSRRLTARSRRAEDPLNLELIAHATDAKNLLSLTVGKGNRDRL